MTPGREGIRLFQLRGITVFLHWTWFLVALYETGRTSSYSSFVWNLLEYLALFAIVTLHEFGHAFACRSVGGRADRIVLWPLGGVAYVDPPPRPGAVLWSIAAGPLVNALLVVPLGILALLSGIFPSDLSTLITSLAYINVALLVFNMLPVYPLDGGQILGALLWFVMGRARSLMVTAVIGLVGLAGFAVFAFNSSSGWLLVMTFFLATRCVGAFRVARAMNRIASTQLRAECECPSCHAHPPVGAFWTCAACGIHYDVFEPGPPPLAVCPKCGSEPEVLKCGRCGAIVPVAGWWAQPAAELARA
jgi:Zn-dependent protease